MAKYKRRPKVKRYRRSFYSRGMRIRKIVGIVVLVAVVLAAAWFAAPHVLDWATHTWYTVVKDRDLEAESASRAAASSQAAASAAASEAASSAASEPEEDVFNGKAIVSGRWAELDTADASLRYQGEKLDLSRNEFRILQVLLEQKGRTVSRDALMQKLWETDSFVDENTLSVNVNRLRRKLDELGLTDFIRTKKGMGYLIENDE